MKREISIDEVLYSVSIVQTNNGRFLKREEGLSMGLECAKLNDDTYSFTVGGNTVEAKAISRGEHVFIEAFGRTFTVNVLDPVEQAHAASEAGDPSPKAPMPGIVVELHVGEGDVVSAGEPLLTIESMKLLTVLHAEGDGVVTAINYQPGDSFNKSEVLVQLMSSEEENSDA